MKSLTIKQIKILSRTEKKARAFKFHPKVNLIIGENDTGKSSLIKSLYHTLGADVWFHPDWEKANAISIITFTFGVKKYSILRHKNIFGVFDESKKLINTYQGITKEFSLFVNELFGFNLKLKMSANKKYSSAPPAFLYLPFYIDQDKGWQTLLSSFQRLGHFTSWKKDLLDYHTGIKPKEFYDIKDKLSKLKIEEKQLLNERDVVQLSKTKIEENFSEISFDFSLDSFQLEIEALLTELNELYKIEDTHKVKLTKLRTQERMIQQQLSVAEATFNEFNKDYEYLTKEIDSDGIDCPTCNTHFENSIINRFSILEDADECQRIMVELSEEMNAVRLKIDSLNIEYNANRELGDKLQRRLSHKKGDLALSDLIQSQTQSQISSTFNSELRKYNDNIFSIETKTKALEKKKRNTTNKERSDTIKKHFKDRLSINLIKLNVAGHFVEDLKDIPISIKESGSDLPRALLAYQYALLDTIFKYSTTEKLPIIFDSPIQQDQDTTNAPKIISFILDGMPSESQLFLGSVGLHEAVSDTEDKNIFILDSERSLLLSEEFDKVNLEVSPMFEAVIESISE